MDSILTSIKKLIGPDEDYGHFDIDLIIHINSAFMVLNQIGVGPKEGFSIADKRAVWTDFIGLSKTLEGVKTYVYLKCKLVFDPPQMGYLVEVIKDQIKELEWRLNVQGESEPVEIPHDCEDVERITESEIDKMFKGGK